MFSFFENLHIPRISLEHRDRLEAPFSVEEVLEVIKHLKSNSAPGPDSFSVAYYKSFAGVLAPYMARFFNHTTRGTPLDCQLNSAFISVIPKPDKDPAEVGIVVQFP